MSTAYRDDLIAARMERDALLERRREALSSVPRAVEDIHALRAARILAGKAAIGCVVALVLVALHGFVAWTLSPSSPGHLDGRLTVMLLSAWIVVAAAYSAGRALGARAFRREIARPADLTGDIRADVERLRDSPPLRGVRDLVQGNTIRSVAYPLAGLVVIVPLSLHLLFFFVLVLFNGQSFVRSSAYFDTWIAASLIVVGHAHLVLIFLARRYAQRLAALSIQELDRSPPPGGMAALAYTLVASLLGGVIGMFVNTTGGLIGTLVLGLIVGVTGMAFVPWSFNSARRRLVRERGVLEGLSMD